MNGEQCKVYETAAEYLDEMGGSRVALINALADEQRPGQAFFNALSERDRERIRGSVVDPFHGGWWKVEDTLDYLIR